MWIKVVRRKVRDLKKKLLSGNDGFETEGRGREMGRENKKGEKKEI